MLQLGNVSFPELTKHEGKTTRRKKIIACPWQDSQLAKRG